MMHPWKHFKTITKHKLLVMHYCFRAGLYRQGLLHDLSKYSPVEFLVGCKYYQGDRSPNNAEREIQDCRNPGCIIREETGITLNTGLIMCREMSTLSMECRCRGVILRRW